MKLEIKKGYKTPFHRSGHIYGNRSKLHIGSYKIIDFKDFNAP